VSQVLAQVRAGSRETFAAAGVKRTPERVEDLLTIAALQTIWGIVNGQHQVLSAALGVKERQDREESAHTDSVEWSETVVAGFRLGNTHISRSSDYVRSVAAARRDLDHIVRQLDVRDLLYMKHVDVVRRLGTG
jgi:hypothetical protein